MTARNMSLESNYLVKNTNGDANKVVARRKSSPVRALFLCLSTRLARLTFHKFCSRNPDIIRPHNQQQHPPHGTREESHSYKQNTMETGLLSTEQNNTRTTHLDSRQTKNIALNEHKQEASKCYTEALTMEYHSTRGAKGKEKTDASISSSNNSQNSIALRGKLRAVLVTGKPKGDNKASQTEKRRSSSFCLDDEGTTFRSLRHRKQRRNSYF